MLNRPTFGGHITSGAALFMFLKIRSILDFAQEQRMPGHRLSGIPPRPRLDEFLHPGGVVLPAPHLDERPDDRPDHIPQEPVRRNPEIPIGRFYSGGGYCIRNRRFATPPTASGGPLPLMWPRVATGFRWYTLPPESGRSDRGDGRGRVGVFAGGGGGAVQ
jgi:hypothetical protein